MQSISLAVFDSVSSSW